MSVLPVASPSSLPTPPAVVVDVANAVVALRPALDVIGVSERGVTIAGLSTLEYVIRVSTQDPECHVAFSVQTWNGCISSEASFSNMPADVVAAAIVAAFELQY